MRKNGSTKPVNQFYRLGTHRLAVVSFIGMIGLIVWCSILSYAVVQTIPELTKALNRNSRLREITNVN